ncbi:MAG: DUF5777 family beta-barrel protein [Daejeonella sp.]
MRKSATFLFLILPFTTLAQDEDLMKLATDSNAVMVKTATFKGNRIINGHSVETVGKKNLDFIISHRFGQVNLGYKQFFGLDAATIRLGLEYGMTNDVMIGLGRSSALKIYDFFGKFKLIKQSSGGSNIPVSITGFGAYTIRTQDTDPKLSANDRSNYTAQLLIARKFSEAFSLQLTPSFIYRNKPDFVNDKKSVLAAGIGGRIKVTRRSSINGEYNYVLPNQIDDSYTNNLSFSYDIDTGGHVFQLLFTNSYGMVERQFITETTGSWRKQDIHFGFNISRTFSFNKQKSKS